MYSYLLFVWMNFCSPLLTEMSSVNSHRFSTDHTKINSKPWITSSVFNEEIKWWKYLVAKMYNTYIYLYIKKIPVSIVSWCSFIYFDAFLRWLLPTKQTEKKTVHFCYTKWIGFVFWLLVACISMKIMEKYRQQSLIRDSFFLRLQQKCILLMFYIIFLGAPKKDKR